MEPTIEDRPETTPDERLPWVDYAKGICILLVVLMYTSFQVEETGGPAGLTRGFVEFARPFRLPDFFFLSGLFLGRVIDRDGRSYLDGKVLHFAWFYLLWTAIRFATKGPVWAFRGDWDAFARIPLALVDPVSTLWFIYVLPLFFIAARALRQLRVPMALAFLVAAGLESLRVHTGWRAIDEFCARGVYFLGGYLFAPLAFGVAAWMARRPGRAVAAIGAWALVNAACVFTPSPLTDHARISEVPMVSLALGFAGALGVISVAAVLQAVGAFTFVRHCGRNSIVIYLAFFLTLDVLKHVPARAGIPAGPAVLAITALSVIFPLVLARCVRGTVLDFLFVRPARFRLIDPPVRGRAG